MRQLARDLAQKSYKAPDAGELPSGLKDLTYDRYRTIRFIPDRSLWRGESLPFEAQFFHRGFIFTDPVAVHQVVSGQAYPIAYSPDLFSFGELERPDPSRNLEFAGFRLHAPLNRPEYYDEVGAFLGASYFRAVAKGQIYGLSARGLSINTGDPKGEEFPAFRAFWIERPQAGTKSIVVHALLDSPSAAAAYRFTIRPGDTTIYDVEMALYPRVDIAQPGIATLTSMFYFAPNDRGGVDDFRPAVHDSDGLAMRNGRGEQLWRPLHNPQDLQVSTFADVNPRAFGLMQRNRHVRDYQDLEAQYEKRPSAWVEPIGDWGEGQVCLFEIPTKNEYNDNIVAFWRPREPLRAKGEYIFVYRLHWGWEDPHAQALARVVQTRVGAASKSHRLFVLDMAGDKLNQLAQSEAIRAEVSGDKGRIEHVVIQRHPEMNCLRLSFQFAPEKATAVDLRAQLRNGDELLSETWTYRWTP